MTKKAISLMISYVLLILIAISLAIAVYAWLKFTVKGIEPLEECPDGVALILNDYKCFPDNTIELFLKNKGNFDVDGFLIKGTENKTKEPWMNLIPKDNLLEIEGTYLLQEALGPGESEGFNLSYQELGSLEKIDVYPIKIKEQRIIFCKNSIISQEISC